MEISNALYRNQLRSLDLMQNGRVDKALISWNGLLVSFKGGSFIYLKATEGHVPGDVSIDVVTDVHEVPSDLLVSVGILTREGANQLAVERSQRHQTATEKRERRQLKYLLNKYGEED